MVSLYTSSVADTIMLPQLKYSGWKLSLCVCVWGGECVWCVGVGGVCVGCGRVCGCVWVWGGGCVGMDLHAQRTHCTVRTVLCCTMIS